MACFVLSGLGCDKSKTHETQLKAIRQLWDTLDVYRAEHFGPSNYETYRRIFRTTLASTEPASASLNAEHYDPEQSAALRVWLISAAGIARLPELRHSLESYYEKTEPLWQKVAEAITSGSYAPPYSQAESALLTYGAYVGYRDPDQQNVVSFAGDNFRKGLVWLAKGDPKKAIDSFAMGLKLAERLIGNCVLGEWPTASTIAVSLKGYDQLLWQPMDAAVARYALDSCRGIRIPVEENNELGTYRSVLRDAALYIIGTRNVEGRPIKDRFGWPDHLFDQLYRAGLTRKENLRWFEQFRQGSQGSARTNQPQYWRKITTTPAMRKRLRHILATEPYFRENRTIFSEASLKELQPELQIFVRRPRRISTQDLYEPDMRLGLLRLALAIRAFRAEKGQWPETITSSTESGKWLFHLEKGRWPASTKELYDADLVFKPFVRFSFRDLYASNTATLPEVDRLVVNGGSVQLDAVRSTRRAVSVQPDDDTRVRYNAERRELVLDGYTGHVSLPADAFTTVEFSGAALRGRLSSGRLRGGDLDLSLEPIRSLAPAPAGALAWVFLAIRDATGIAGAVAILSLLFSLIADPWARMSWLVVLGAAVYAAVSQRWVLAGLCALAFLSTRLYADSASTRACFAAVLKTVVFIGILALGRYAHRRIEVYRNRVPPDSPGAGPA